MYVLEFTSDSQIPTQGSFVVFSRDDPISNIPFICIWYFSTSSVHLVQKTFVSVVAQAVLNDIASKSHLIGLGDLCLTLLGCS